MQDVAVPGLEGFSEDQAYRAMDILVEADAAAKVQQEVFLRDRDPAHPGSRPAALTPRTATSDQIPTPRTRKAPRGSAFSDTFRDLKSNRDIRPVFHGVEPRIRACVLIC